MGTGEGLSEGEYELPEPDEVWAVRRVASFPLLVPYSFSFAGWVGAVRYASVKFERVCVVVNWFAGVPRPGDFKEVLENYCRRAGIPLLVLSTRYVLLNHHCHTR